MTKNYFAPHKIFAKIFCAPSKIGKNFSYPIHICSARVPGIKNARSLRGIPLIHFLAPIFIRIQEPALEMGKYKEGVLTY